MMEGEGVESKTGSAMHSSERPSPLADERGVGGSVSSHTTLRV